MSCDHSFDVFLHCQIRRRLGIAHPFHLKVARALAASKFFFIRGRYVDTVPAIFSSTVLYLQKRSHIALQLRLKTCWLSSNQHEAGESLSTAALTATASLPVAVGNDAKATNEAALGL